MLELQSSLIWGHSYKIKQCSSSWCTNMTCVYQLWINDKAKTVAARRKLFDDLRVIWQYNIVKKYEHYVKTLLVSI